MWVVAVILFLLIVGIPDTAHSTPNYRISLTLDENVIKIEKQIVEIKFTKDQRILKGVYNVPKIQPSKDIPKTRLPNKRVLSSRNSSTVSYPRNSVIDYVRSRNRATFGEQHWNSLYTLLSKESGWQVGRVNPSSYACGLGQSLPCSKTYPGISYDVRDGDFVRRDGKLFVANPSLSKETTFLINYIKNRYGTPTNALSFWYGHNWY